MKVSRIKPALLAILVFSCASTSFLHAQSLVLDTELDSWFNTLTAPLKKSLPRTADTHVVMVPEDQINAFVTEEDLVYIYSGLILKAKTAEEVQGVLAHELGHISAQHVRQMQGAMGRSTGALIAGAVVGLGTAIAGAPQAGSAIMATSQAGVLSNLLRFSRTNESEADRRGLNALHAAGLSGQGLVTLLGTLRTNAQLSYDTPPPYLLTHPLPAARIQNLAASVAEEPSPTHPLFPAEEFRRIQAKVFALSRSPAETLRTYPNNTEDSARYARAIAYARQGKGQMAQQELAPLLQKHPNNMFYLETRGALALDAGRLDDAKTDFTAVLARNPEFIYTRFQLAEVLRAQGNPQAALPHLQRLTRDWPIWANPWGSLGLVYGELGQISRSHLALTEQALHSGEAKQAEEQLALARIWLAKSPDADASNWAQSLEPRVKNALSRDKSN